MLFSGHKFIVEDSLSSSELRDEFEDPEAKFNANEIGELIQSNGGELIEWRDRLDGRIAPHLIVVAQDAHFPHYEELENLMVPVVTAEWVKECINVQKLIPTRPYSPDAKKVLRDVIICCGGLSRGDVDALQAGVRVLGGDWTEVPTKFTTHIVTLDPEHPHAQIARESGLGIHIVSPEWIDDCMKLQQRLNDSSYILAHPDATQEPVSQSAVSRSGTSGSGKGTGVVLAATYDAEDGENQNPRLAVQRSMHSSLGSSIFAGRAFFLATDLDISAALHKTVVFLIETNGGVVVDELGLASVYLGKWREGIEYKDACSRRLTVGNLTWLYWMAIQQRWESPLHHLLHYPEVKDGMPEMRGSIVAITNYTGDSRTYLQMLIKALGAQYTGTLTEGVSTHLIAAHTDGAKCQAAAQWGIPIVNHLWLEETYSNWQVQSTTLPRYTHYPKRLDMSTLIGCTALAPRALRQFYEQKHEPERAHRPARAARDKADQLLHADVLKENEFQRQRKKHDLPELTEEMTEQSAVTAEVTLTRRAKQYEDQVTKMPLGAVPTNVEAPATAPLAKSSSGSGSGSGSSSGSANANTTSMHRKKKAKQTKRDDTTHELLVSPAALTESAKVVPLTIMTTGIDSISPKNKKLLAKLNVKLVERGAKVLVAARVLRTPKFLTALAHVDEVVTEDWLKMTLSEGAVQPFESYRLESGNFQQIMEKAKALRSKNVGLFTGLSFWLATNVKAGPEIVGQILKAHGGHIVHQKGKGVLAIHEDGVAGELCLEDVITAILAMESIEPQP